MLKRALALTILLALFAGIALSPAAPTHAQDDSPSITCDSTLILLLYVAEHDYSFHSMSDTAPFEKGVYAPLFDEMMANDMGEDDMMSPEATMEADMSDSMSSEDEMMPLAPGVVQGEDMACTELRAELEGFFYNTFTQAMMNDEG
jgi:hypothetical protein